MDTETKIAAAFLLALLLIGAVAGFIVALRSLFNSPN